MRLQQVAVETEALNATHIDSSTANSAVGDQMKPPRDPAFCIVEVHPVKSQGRERGHKARDRSEMGRFFSGGDVLVYTNKKVFARQGRESATLVKLSSGQKARFLSLLWLIFQNRKASVVDVESQTRTD